MAMRRLRAERQRRRLLQQVFTHFADFALDALADLRSLSACSYLQCQSELPSLLVHGLGSANRSHRGRAHDSDIDIQLVQLEHAADGLLCLCRLVSRRCSKVQLNRFSSDF